LGEIKLDSIAGQWFAPFFMCGMAPLSSVEAPYSRALTAHLGKNAWRLRKGKKYKVHRKHCSLCPSFLSPALSLPFLLSLVFTNRSLCGVERGSPAKFEG